MKSNPTTPSRSRDGGAGSKISTRLEVVMSRARWFVVATSGLLLSGSIAVAQQQGQNQQKQGPTGEARIVQRQGPKIECKNGARPVAAVIFTDAQQSQGQGQAGDLVIAIVEADPQNAGNDREALFEKKNALDGVVTHDFGAQGASGEGKRTLMITGRRGTETVEIQQIGSAGQNAMIYAVRKAKPEQQNQQNLAQEQQQQQQQQQQQADQAQAQAQQDAAAQQAAAQQAAEKQKQEEQAAQKKAEAAPAEENDAVIMVYMVGTAQQ